MEKMLAKISQSLLNDDDAVSLGFRYFDSGSAKRALLPGAGFKIPYFNLDGSKNDFFRYRLLEDTRSEQDIADGKKSLRYYQTKGSPVEAYYPPPTKWSEVMKDTSIAVLITEGELKAACAAKLGFPTIGLGGVWSFKSNSKKISFLESLEKIAWSTRVVFIIYDSDAATNPQVVAAENALAAELTRRGARAKIVRMPQDGSGKVGLDDYLLVHTPDEFRELLLSAVEYELSERYEALSALNSKVVYIRSIGIVYELATGNKMAPTAFTSHTYANQWHTEINKKGEPVAVQSACAWLKWKNRAELESLVFKPGCPRVVGGSLNTWKGWDIEPVEGDVSPWTKLLDHVFMSDKSGAREWFEDWVAYPLQNPGSKMPSCSLLWGRVHGSGKTFVGRLILDVYGSYGTDLTDSELNDARMDWAEGRQFALMDDVTGSRDNRHLANKIKTMVSQKTLHVNQKYIPRYSVPDVLNYMFTGNAPDTFLLEDKDRRNFIWEVEAGVLPKFLREEINAWRASNGAAKLFNYFLKRDISKFDPQAPAFQTSALEDMKVLSKSDVGLWVSQLAINRNVLKLKGDLFTSSELLAMYDVNGAGKVGANGVARAMRDAGYRCPGKQSYYTTKFGGVRLFAVYNVDKWHDAETSDIIRHYEENRDYKVEKF